MATLRVTWFAQNSVDYLVTIVVRLDLDVPRSQWYLRTAGC